MIYFASKLCALTDAYLQTPLDYIGSGYIVFAAQVRKPLEQFAKQLARDLSGAIFFAANFTMLVYPVGASAWSFLDDALPDVPVGAILKFVVRKPLLPQTPLNEHSDLRNWMGLNSRLVESTMHDSAVARESLNVAFKDQFDIEFPRLIGTKAAVFFLCFAPSGKWFDMMSTLDQDRIKLKVSAEHDEVVDFLHSNKAEVYSMHDYGVSDPVENRAWFYFSKCPSFYVLRAIYRQDTASRNLTCSSRVCKEWRTHYSRLLFRNTQDPMASILPLWCNRRLEIVSDTHG